MKRDLSMLHLLHRGRGIEIMSNENNTYIYVLMNPMHPVSNRWDLISTKALR